MKTAKSISIVLIAIAIASCNTPTSQPSVDAHAHDEHDGHAHTWACPMHPEVTGHEGDKCSKCGMPLEEMHGNASSAKFKMELSSASTQIEAGKETTLSFKPVNESNPAALVPLDVVHEKKIHLIAVSEDLSFFRHIHPEYNTDGTYSVKETFPSGGNYILYADFKPSGGSHTVEKINVAASGTPKSAIKYDKENITYTSPDGIGMSLKADYGHFDSGVEIHFDGVLTENGKEVDVNKLDNYLGAKGHMVAVDVAEKTYLHVHPEVEGTILHHHATFPKPGLYRIWLQFMYKGKLYTADYVINAVAGEAHAHDNAGAHTH